MNDQAKNQEAKHPQILHLNVQKKWFDMIASGKKKEEYRQDKMYWKVRFVKKGYWHSQTCKDFDIIRFKNCYSKNAPVIDVECKGIRIADITDINKDWFGPLKEYQGLRVFIITLGQLLTPMAGN